MEAIASTVAEGQLVGSGWDGDVGERIQFVQVVVVNGSCNRATCGGFGAPAVVVIILAAR